MFCFSETNISKQVIMDLSEHINDVLIPIILLEVSDDILMLVDFWGVYIQMYEDQHLTRKPPHIVNNQLTSRLANSANLNTMVLLVNVNWGGSQTMLKII